MIDHPPYRSLPYAMPAAEHLLKGLFVALALHAGIWASADPSARWGTLAAIDGIAMAGLVVSLGWAAMRTAPPLGAFGLT